MDPLNLRGTHDPKYFYVSSYKNPEIISAGSPFVRAAGENIISPSMKESATIEVPNDRNRTETKIMVFDHTVRHLVITYQLNTGKLLTRRAIFDIREERVVGERLANERVVTELSDLMLEDDKEALFEERWERYEMGNLGVKLQCCINN